MPDGDVSAPEPDAAPEDEDGDEVTPTAGLDPAPETVEPEPRPEPAEPAGDETARPDAPDRPPLEEGPDDEEEAALEAEGPEAEPEGESEAGPETEAEDGGVGAVAERVEALATEVNGTAREETVAAGFAELREGVDELVRLTRRADEHVGELHAENQRLRAGELASVTLPLLRDVVRLHDEVVQLASACHAEARTDLDLVRSRLLDTLARWGLTPFAPEVGAAVDATRHQGVGRVPSSDGEPGTIATVRRPGFAHDDGRTFRAAEVEVFQAPPEPPAAPEPPPAPGPHDHPRSGSPDGRPDDPSVTQFGNPDEET